MNMRKIKVGILGCNDVGEFFKNGLYQNAWSLGKMLNDTGEFDVSLISEGPCKSERTIGLNCFQHNIDILKEQDVIIQVAYSVKGTEAKILQKKGIKLILTKYGNNLATDIETYVQYNLDLKPKFDLNEWFRLSHSFTPDLLLYSPHFEFQKQYMTLTAGISEDLVKPCPYIWNPFFINTYSEIYKKKLGNKYSLEYVRGDARNNSIASVEPSIAFIKANLVPIIMINEAYKESPELMRHAHIFNSELLIAGENGKLLSNRMTFLKAFKEKAMTLERRLPMIDIFANKARLLVSHQILNSLNYTYFEFALNGYPFVHNSELLSEYGYYYDGCSVLDGKDKIKEALQHDELSDKEIRIYNNSCEEMLWKHSPMNPKNISGYTELIKSVL